MLMQGAAAALALAALGCAPAPLALPGPDMAGPRSTVDVTLEPGGFIGNIDSFKATATVGAEQLDYSTVPAARPGTIPPALTFSILLPPFVAGAIELRVRAFDADGLQVGHGDSPAGMLGAPPTEIALDVPMEPG